MEDFNSKYSGEQVEALLDQVASGNAGGGGGGGITVETDPIFSASPAATITENDKAVWSGKQDAISDLEAIRSGANKGATALQEHQSLKTINGESIVGSGDITIAGGSGEVGPQGPQGDKGDTGVGVQSVTQTTTSNADGGSNVVTVTLTDGTKSTFTVKNGSKGSQGIQGEQGPKGDKGDKGDTGANGTNGKDGADGADGATFTPSVDSNGNLSWTNNKGLTNPPTVNIKGPKGDAGEGGGSTGGKEVIALKVSAIDELEGNKIYVMDNMITDLMIRSFSSNADVYETYDIIFKTTEFLIGGFYMELPDSIIWANGIIPTIEADTVYELSIVRTTIDSIDNFSAVLTPFKPV